MTSRQGLTHGNSNRCKTMLLTLDILDGIVELIGLYINDPSNELLSLTPRPQSNGFCTSVDVLEGERTPNANLARTTYTSADVIKLAGTLNLFPERQSSKNDKIPFYRKLTLMPS